MNNDLRLIFDFFDDSLTEQEFAELNRCLAENEHLRRLFVRVARLHSEFRNAFHSEDIRLLLDPDNELDRQMLEYLLVVERESTGVPRPTLVEPEESIEPVTPDQPQLRRFWGDLKYTGVAVGMIAALLVITVFITPQTKKTPFRVGTLKRSINAHWNGLPNGLQPGDEINTGWLELTEGVAEFSIGNYAAVILEAPSRVRLNSAAEMELVRGNLTAEIYAPGQDLTVVTPHSRVVDLGTAFGVRVSQAGFVDVAVFDGHVQVGNDASGSESKASWVKMSEGTAARLAPGEVTPKQLEPLSPKLRSSFVQDWDEVLVRPKFSGNVRFAGATPDDLSLGQMPSGYTPMVFIEGTQLALPQPIEAEIAQPGRYQREELIAADANPQVLIPAGQVVNSYLVHVDPSDAPAGVNAQFELTFRKPILGIIVSGRRLALTDGLMQLQVAEGDSLSRGITGKDEGDTLILRENGHQIWFRLTAQKAGDQVRIITEGYSEDEL